MQQNFCNLGSLKNRMKFDFGIFDSIQNWKKLTLEPFHSDNCDNTNVRWSFLGFPGTELIWLVVVAGCWKLSQCRLRFVFLIATQYCLMRIGAKSNRSVINFFALRRQLPSRCRCMTSRHVVTFTTGRLRRYDAKSLEWMAPDEPVAAQSCFFALQLLILNFSTFHRGENLSMQFFKRDFWYPDSSLVFSPRLVR